jgi:hypothetical protein
MEVTVLRLMGYNKDKVLAVVERKVKQFGCKNNKIRSSKIIH